MICPNITVNEKNHLCFAGRDTTQLAEKYFAYRENPAAAEAAELAAKSKSVRYSVRRAD